MATVTIPKTVRPLLGSITRTFVMAEASQLGRFCIVGASATLTEAAGDEAATSDGVIVWLMAGSAQNTNGTVASGETVTAVVFGPVAVPGGTFDPTTGYFLSDTVSTVDGLMADAAGTVTRRLGRGLESEVFFFNPDISEATSS